MRPQEVWGRDIKVGLRLVCIRARPLAVPQVAAPEALATVSFPAPQGLKPNFPSNPTARLKPCPDTKPKTKPRVPLRSDSCEFRRIGSSATFMSHTRAISLRLTGSQFRRIMHEARGEEAESRLDQGKMEIPVRMLRRRSS